MDNEMIDRLVPILMKHNPQTKIGAAIVIVELMQAMREPTEKMKEAFDNARPVYDDPPTSGEEYWQGGIDAVIND